MKKPYLLDFNPVGSPERGFLSVVHAAGQLPFVVNRLYWIYDVPELGERGNQAHLHNEQVLVTLHGAVRVHLENTRGKKFAFELHRPDQGLFVPARYWRTLHFYDHAVVLALCSHPYREADYVRSHEAFRTLATDDGP